MSAYVENATLERNALAKYLLADGNYPYTTMQKSTRRCFEYDESVYMSFRLATR
jgi:hypothetical protein